MLYRILLNFCIGQEDILHYFTALSGLKSVQKCKGYYRAYFFHRHFLKELSGFSRLGHVVSTKDSWCFIGSFLTFVFNKRTYCTTWQRCQNQNRLKNVGFIASVHFFIGIFLRQLIGFLRIDHVFSTIDSWCFIGSLKLLHLTRRHTAQHDSVVRIKIGYKR